MQSTPGVRNHISSHALVEWVSPLHYDSGDGGVMFEGPSKVPHLFDALAPFVRFVSEHAWGVELNVHVCYLTGEICVDVSEDELLVSLYLGSRSLAGIGLQISD